MGRPARGSFSDWASAIGLVLLLVVMVSGGIYVAVSNYQECREHGFSLLYCLTNRR